MDALTYAKELVQIDSVSRRSNQAASDCVTQFLSELGFTTEQVEYRDPNGELKLKPVVEINPRVTMGRIAHELSAHNGPGSVGYFQILTRSQLRRQGHSNFADLAQQLQQDHPVELTKESKTRIASGSFALNDPQAAKQFLALYHVRKTIQDLDSLK